MWSDVCVSFGPIIEVDTCALFVLIVAVSSWYGRSNLTEAVGQAHKAIAVTSSQ